MTHLLTARGSEPRMRARSALGVLATTLVISATVAERGQAQVVVQDDKGHTAFTVYDAGFVGFNTADGSAEISYFRLQNKKKLFLGGAARAKSTDGLAGFFQQGAANPGVSLEGTVGWKVTGQEAISVKYKRSWISAALIDSAALPVATFSKTGVFTWEAGLQGSTFRSSRWAAGLGIGVRRLNNFEDLPKGTIQTTRTRTDPTSGATVTLFESNEGRVGTLATERVTYLDGDLLVVPFTSAPVSTRVFGRGLLSRENASTQRNSGGIDVGVHKYQGDPVLDRMVALVLTINEARPGDKKTDLKQRVTVGAVANLLPIIGELAKGTK